MINGCGQRASGETPARGAAADRSGPLEVTLRAAARQTARIVVAPARRGVRRSAVTAAGTIEFTTHDVARVGPLLEGRLLTIAVEPGQSVTRGAELARVQSTEVGRARSEQVAAVVRSRAASLELDRQQRMADAGVTSGRDLVAAQAQRSLAQLELRASLERLHALGIGSVGPGGVSTVPLLAPIDGVVLRVDARVGQTVSAADTLFVVGRTDRVWLIADVYERDYARVHVGDEARVRLVAYPERTFGGRVENIGGIVDPQSRAASVRIVMENAGGVIRPGMSATARIVAPDAQGTPVVIVPRGALQTIDGQPYVFIDRHEGRFEVRPIARGDDFEGDVEVLTGLAAGEPVVTEGAFILKSEVLRAQMGAND